jgi:hypothetical protein
LPPPFNENDTPHHCGLGDITIESLPIWQLSRRRFNNEAKHGLIINYRTEKINMRIIHNEKNIKRV